MKIRDCFYLNPPKNSNIHKDYINYIDTSSVTDGKLDEVSYLTSDFPSRAQRMVQYGDILYSSVRPNLKHYYYYRDSYSHPIASSGFVLLRNKDTNQCDTEFTYYYLSTKEVVSYLSNIAESSQATFPSFLPKDLGGITLPIVNVKTQRRIASILSAYDSLIENNQKRIKLLEQMAENLYKEWFVRFRFPGYENAEFEGGVPKGWIIVKLNSVANIVYGFPFNSSCFCSESSLNPVVRIRDIADKHTETYTPEKPDDKYLIHTNDILIGMDGIFHMNIWTNEGDYLNQRVVKVSSKMQYLSNQFLFYSLFPQVKMLESIISGTTVAHLSAKDMNKMTVLIPSDDVLRLCFSKFENIMSMRRTLLVQNDLLTHQRDLLLPRLMSGKLSI